jgi:CBS domain-containing protein
MPGLELRLAGEHQVFAPPLASMVRRTPVTCGEELSTGDAVRLMRSQRVGSVVVVDRAGRHPHRA